MLQVVRIWTIALVVTFASASSVVAEELAIARLSLDGRETTHFLPGAVVTIEGHGFDESAFVSVDDGIAQIISRTRARIIATLPPECAPGPTQLTVHLGTGEQVARAIEILEGDCPTSSALDSVVFESFGTHGRTANVLLAVGRVAKIAHRARLVFVVSYGHEEVARVALTCSEDGSFRVALGPFSTPLIAGPYVGEVEQLKPQGEVRSLRGRATYYHGTPEEYADFNHRKKAHYLQVAGDLRQLVIDAVVAYAASARHHAYRGDGARAAAEEVRSALDLGDSLGVHIAEAPFVDERGGFRDREYVKWFKEGFSPKLLEVHDRHRQFCEDRIWSVQPRLAAICDFLISSAFRLCRAWARDLFRSCEKPLPRDLDKSGFRLNPVAALTLTQYLENLDRLLRAAQRMP